MGEKNQSLSSSLPVESSHHFRDGFEQIAQIMVRLPLISHVLWCGLTLATSVPRASKEHHFLEELAR